MGRGRKKIPTRVKELKGTLQKCRQTPNEFTATLVKEIPEPPNWLTEIGVDEWYKVCSELYNKQMLHKIDLLLIASYCNMISLHIETEIMLREKGRIQVYRNEDGSIKHAQALPYVKISRDALDAALKIAVQFGLTPSSRTNISQPVLIQENNEYNFFD